MDTKQESQAELVSSGKTIARPKRNRSHFWPYGLAAGIYVADQISKLVAENAFAPYGSGKELVVVDGWLRFLWFKNTGASFGLLNEHPWIFALLASGVAIGIVIWYEWERPTNNWYRATLGMIFAGTVGNLTDRLFKGGAVTDFINIPNLEFLFKIFNVADMSLTFGVATLLVYTLYRSVVPEKLPANSPDTATENGKQL